MALAREYSPTNVYFKLAFIGNSGTFANQAGLLESLRLRLRHYAQCGRIGTAVFLNKLLVLRRNRSLPSPSYRSEEETPIFMQTMNKYGVSPTPGLFLEQEKSFLPELRHFDVRFGTGTWVREPP